jgi:serine/threonine-protein kinase
MARTGRTAEEIALRRKLVAADPLNERATAGLVRALALVGDRGEALRHVRAYETLTREELGIAPDPNLAAMVGDLASARAEGGRDEDPAPAPAPRPALVPGCQPRHGSSAFAKVRPLRATLVIVSTVILVSAIIARSAKTERLASGSEASSAMLIAPFRVTGADSSLHYLGEGMIDLLAVTLTGERGPRAVDPRTTLSVWQRSRTSSAGGGPTVPEMLSMAGALGATQLLLGEVVGVPGHVIISASVLRASDGKVVARARVEGPQDSLGVVVDALTAQLLTVGTSNRSASELSASLPALRAYLQGESAYRGGRYTEAVESFHRAVACDSSFAIAALGLALSVGWTPSAEDDEPGIQLAWSLRDRLSPKDRALLGARVSLPRLSAISTRDKLVEKELAKRLAPDRAETWFWLGDDLFHEGALVGDARARARSASLFQRSLELDSSSAPLGHLVELAALSGDTAEAARLGALFVSRDSTGDLADFIRWRVALATQNERALVEVRRRFPKMKMPSLLHMLMTMQHDGIGLDDVDSVVAVLQGRVSGLQRADQQAVWSALWELALNRGRPLDAVAAGRRWRAAAPDPGNSQDREYYERVIGDALFSDGDSAAAEASARELEAYGTMEQVAARSNAASSVCALHLWQVTYGDTRMAGKAIGFLSAVAANRDSAVSSQSMLCAVTLQVLLEALRPDQRRTDHLLHLDSLLRTGPVGFPVMSFDGANVAIIGPLVARGEDTAALAASRRHLYGRGPIRMLAALLVHEARLSSITGDTAAAVRAYSHYLALRQNAEPSRRRQVDQMRSELARLQPRH